MENSSVKKKAPHRISSLSRYYLIAYNFLSALGWLYVLALTIATVFRWRSLSDVLVSRHLYATIRWPLKILLATAGAEVVHALARLVSSNPLIVFVQVVIRFLVVWGITDAFATSSQSIGVVGLTLCWPAVEIVRYSYYAFNLLNQDPYVLKWLRYNMFIVIYPIGALAEMICIGYGALQIGPAHIRQRYSLTLPNPFNFAVDLSYVLWFWVFIYFPLFPLMYKHMLSQRQKCLYARSATKPISKQN